MWSSLVLLFCVNNWNELWFFCWNGVKVFTIGPGFKHWRKSSAFCQRPCWHCELDWIFCCSLELRFLSLLFPEERRTRDICRWFMNIKFITVTVYSTRHILMTYNQLATLVTKQLHKLIQVHHVQVGGNA